MNRSFCLRATLVITPLLAAFAAPAMAGDSIKNVSIATGQSAKASGQLVLAGVKVVAGVVSAPFVILGAGAESSGRAVKESGRAVWDDANAPLPVSDETVIAQSAPVVPYDHKTGTTDTSAKP